MKLSHVLLTLGSLAPGLLVASTASAAGLSTARFGGEHGTPMTTNPTAIYYNPAGLTITEGLDVFADVNFAWRTASYERAVPQGCEAGANTQACQAIAGGQEVPEPIDAAGANNGSASLTNVAAAPMVGAKVRIPFGEGETGKDWGAAIGVGFFVPFGGQSSWSQNESLRNSPYPGVVDGTQRWWSIDGILRTLYFSGAAAFNLSRYVAVGVSGGAAITQVNTIRARTAAGNNNIAAEGRSWLDASSVDPQLGFGIMATPLADDPDNDLRIGLSAQMRPGITGDVKVKGLLYRYLSGEVSGDVEGQDDVEMNVGWPNTFRFGVAYGQPKSFEVRLFGDYTTWSNYRDNCIVNEGQPCDINEDGSSPQNTNTDAAGNAITGDDIVNNVPRRWEDSFGIRLSGSYWVMDDLELILGVGYDGNAIPDATLAPDVLDFDDVSVALGANYQITEWLGGMLTYTQFIYLPRDTTGQGRNGRFLSPSNGPDSSGEFSQNIGVINLNFLASFDVFDRKSPRPAPADPPAPIPVEEPTPIDVAPEPIPEPEPIPQPPPVEPAPTDADDTAGDDADSADGADDAAADDDADADADDTDGIPDDGAPDDEP